MNGSTKTLIDGIVVLVCILSFTFLAATGNGESGAAVLTGGLAWAGGSALQSRVKPPNDL